MPDTNGGAPVLLVVETEGAAEIAQEAAARGWRAVFLRTDAYKSWLGPVDEAVVGTVLHEPAPDFYRLHRLARELGARAVLPVSLLEPECARDALLRDLCERSGGPVVVASPPSSVELAFDKWLTKQVLADAGFQVIPGRLAGSTAEARAAAEELGYPLVVKPRRDFTGKGFRIFREPAELEAYLAKYRVRDLMFEPFIPGSELSLELVRWRGRCVAQPVVYKGETRLNAMEHPVYRPRLSPWRGGTGHEAEVVSAGRAMAAVLGLEGACEMEFVVSGGRPYLMEVNPRLSGVTRLCNAGGGANTFRLLARLAMGGELDEAVQHRSEVAVSLPIVVPTQDPRVQRLNAHPAVRYIKTIDWMPQLPIRGSVLLQAPSLAQLRSVVSELESLTSPAYLDELHASLAAHLVPN